MKKFRTGFCRVAPYYDWAARICSFDQIFRSQSLALSWIDRSKLSILVVGGGTGRLLEEILDWFDRAYVEYIDSSPEMIAQTTLTLSRRSRRDQERVVLRCVDIQVCSFSRTFDLCITPYVLDVFLQPEAISVIRRIDSVLENSGHLLYSDFAHPRKINILRRLVISGLYKAFRYICGLQARELPILEPTWRTLNYRLIQSQTFAGGFLLSQLWERPSSEKHAEFHRAAATPSEE